LSGRVTGRLRIVGGSKRGHMLRVPRSAGVRPTGEMVREAIFDVLGPIGGLAVADVFAGTGAMGLEALSRGARSCLFVEKDPVVARVLRANVQLLGFEGAARIIQADYAPTLRSVAERQEAFDLLFVDPPYRMLAEVEVLLTPLLPRLLAAEGLVVVEGDGSSEVAMGGTPVFERAYGDTRVTMVRL
jgi:16S rRNA (guanine966-N2)-methyltransferase